MRRIAFISLAAVALAACSNDTTSPATSDPIADFTIGAFGTALTSAGGYEADLYQLRLFNGLPSDLALTPDQQARIKALVDAFNAATKADRDALNAIIKQAHDAREAHKTKDEIKAILDQGIPIRTRLSAAEAALKTAIDAVLTPEQRAWLAAHQPKRCDPSKFTPLSDAQKAQMKSLEQAFEQNNKADLEAVKAGLRQIKDAIAAGKSKDDVQAILDGIKPAIDRLEAARKALHDALEAVLTPDQKASGCIPLG
jgi:Spy/CpxP family protein refolding chaperone